MANLQKLNPTQQELYNYLEQQTGQVNFEVLQPFTTQEMGAVLHISRNTVSQYLNEFFKEGWMVKINTRPVYYFLRETLSRKFNVQTLDAEYEDLQFLQQDLNHGRRADSCFAGVIGYHLSLKSAVEKCRVAVEYPPTGLPLVLAGEKGTGKRLLAGKTWEYAKEKQVVPAESRFAELDCAMWGAAEPGGTGFAASFKRRLEAGTGSDFLYLHGFDQLESSVQAEAVRFLTAVLPELGAKYPRLIFGVQTVPPSLKNSVPVQAELLPLRSRSLLEKKRLIYHFLMQEEQRIGRRVQVTGQAYQMLMQYPYVKYGRNVQYKVNQKTYNYTGISYDIDRLELITDVDRNSPAYASGLRPRDVIEKINDNKMNYSAEEFTAGYKNFISKTMKFRDPKTQFTDANGFKRCMFWDTFQYPQVADALQKSGNVGGFSYLYYYAPYVNPTGNNACTFEIKRGKNKMEMIVRPTIRREITVEIK